MERLIPIAAAAEDVGTARLFTRTKCEGEHEILIRNDQMVLIQYEWQNDRLYDLPILLDLFCLWW